jgi:hypothetical protein
VTRMHITATMAATEENDSQVSSTYLAYDINNVMSYECCHKTIDCIGSMDNSLHCKNGEHHRGQ